MQFQTFPIEAALRSYLVRIWAFRGVLPLGDLRLIAPSGEMKLILPFHGAPTSTTRGISYRHTESSCSIVGQLTSPSTISAVGAIGMLGVTFKPAGARCFLGLPLAEIAESIVSSGDLPGSDWDDLASRVAETAAITTKVRKVQEFLIRSLQRGDVDHRALDLAVREIELSRGVIRIHDLSDRVGWTRRHLDREFSERVGLSPKSFANIVRFQRLYALGLVSGDWPRSLDELYESYYDQAHFIRQFERFTGYAPGAFRGRQNAFGRLFLSPRSVPILQYASPDD